MKSKCICPQNRQQRKKTQMKKLMLGVLAAVLIIGISNCEDKSTEDYW